MLASTPATIRPSLAALAAVAAILLPGPGASRAAADDGAACASTVGARLERCLAAVSRRELRCHRDERAACEEGDPRIDSALDALEHKVRDACAAPGAIAGAGLGDALDLDGLVARLRDACTGETGALAARSFGGPHAQVLGSRNQAQRACLAEAYRQGTKFLQQSFRAHSRCELRHRGGRTCEGDDLERKVDRYAEAARRRIARKCPNLAELVLLPPAEFLDRTAAQARCLVPIAHGESAGLDLDCGPRDDVPVPAPATATQVVLDEAEWGTRCGDGSPYAFWVHLAPDGSPPENVVIHMQGGGACFFNDDCRSVSSGRLRALDNTLPTGGLLSNTNAANPFRDWTKVFLPYCTQDVHIGGGETSVFPDVTVHRFGARNVRAALRWVRDAIWKSLDETPAGYRPDRLRVIFGGTSAGGFGASYNYHYLLDDLRWSRTTALPDAAVGVDNGEILGMRGLRILFTGWGADPMLPPYCAGEPCSIVPEIQTRHAARLGSVPEQQILNVSNQVDQTQVSTTFFPSLRAWIDALRVAYCETQGLPGIRYFLPANPSNMHGIVASGAHFPSGLSSDGVTIGDWLGDAVADPGSVVDRVEEGDFVTRHGVAPFACPVGGLPP